MNVLLRTCPKKNANTLVFVYSIHEYTVIYMQILTYTSKYYLIYFHVFSPFPCSYMDIYLFVFVSICQYMLVFKARKSVSRIDTSIYVQNGNIRTRYKQKYCNILAKPYHIRTLFLRFQNHIFLFDVHFASICSYF